MIPPLTYDNRDLRLVEEEYHTSVTGSHCIDRHENAYDALGRRYQRGVCKVNKTTGEDKPRHFFFDNRQCHQLSRHLNSAKMFRSPLIHVERLILLILICGGGLTSCLPGSHRPVNAENLEGRWFEFESTTAKKMPGSLLFLSSGLVTADNVPLEIVTVDESGNPERVTGSARWRMISRNKKQAVEITWPASMSPPDGYSNVGYLLRTKDGIAIEFDIGDPDDLNSIKFQKIDP